MYISWRTGHGTTKALRHTEYGQARRRTKRQGLWILGSQVVSDAAGTELRRRVREAVTEWASAMIHLSGFADIAQVFTEQVQAQTVARTQGALPCERDLYKLAAPMGRF